MKTKTSGTDYEGIIISIDRIDPETVMVMWAGIQKGNAMASEKRDMYAAIKTADLSGISGVWNLPDNTFSF